jgi:hypothetical protein
MIFFFILNLKSTEEIGDCCFPQKTFLYLGIRGSQNGSLQLKELVKNQCQTNELCNSYNA